MVRFARMTLFTAIILAGGLFTHAAEAASLAPSPQQEQPAAIPTQTDRGSTLQVQALQPNRTAQPEQMVSTLPDRMIWQGQYRCGANAIDSYFVLLGYSVKEAQEAYLFTDQDKSAKDSMKVYPIIVKYNVRYDDVLDGLKLTYKGHLVQGNGAEPPRQLDLAFEQQQSVIKGRLDPSCEFALSRKAYSAGFVMQLSKLKTDAAFTPPVSLTSAQNEDEFCLALAAWTQRVKAAAGERDLTKTLGPDAASQMFLMSVFYDQFARPYLGRDITKINRLNREDDEVIRRWYQGIDQCKRHPLFFDDQALYTRIFYYVVINIYNLQAPLNKIPEIQSRVDRVAQAGDRFSEDVAGLARLKEYVGPLEAELAGALPLIRDTMLRPIHQRQAAIGVVILRRELDEGEGSRSLERLIALDETVRLVRTLAAARDDSKPLLARTEDAIATDLQTLLAAEQRSIQATPESLDGLVQMKAWQVATAAKFVKFTAHPSYQAAMQVVDTRTAAIQRQVVQDLPRSIAQAPDAMAIRGIRTSIDDYQKGTKDSQLTAPLWAAYRTGLTDWFSTAVSKAPQAAQTRIDSLPAAANPLGSMATLPSGDGQTASAFATPNLKEGKLVLGIYKRDFRAVYAEKDRTQSYLVEMLRVIGPMCPGSVSADFFRSILKQQMGPDALSDPAKAGLQVLMGMVIDAANASRNPGGWMNDKIKDAEFSGRAQADAWTILRSCDDPALKTFLANAEAFFTDPTVGVPASELAMGDVCKRAMPENEADYRKEKYCSCAGPVFDQSLGQTEKKFVLLNPRQNFWDALQLIPDLRTKAGKCAL
jgi:hypothetical protein